MNSMNSAVINGSAEIQKVKAKPIEMKPQELVFNEVEAAEYLEARESRAKSIIEKIRENRREKKALRLAKASIESLSEEKPLYKYGDAEARIKVATNPIERAKGNATIDPRTLRLVEELVTNEEIVPLEGTGIEEITVEKYSHAYSEVLSEDSLVLRAIHQHVAA